MGIDAKGQVIIVEIKVSRADLLGDGKWTDYLDYCDRFYWGLPPGLDRAPLEAEPFSPSAAASSSPTATMARSSVRPHRCRSPRHAARSRSSGWRARACGDW